MLVFQKEDIISQKAWRAFEKVVSVSALVLSIQTAFGEERIYPDGYLESFLVHGNVRTIIVRGKSLNQVHIYAANNFSRYLERDFKNHLKSYAIKQGSFKTSVKKTVSGYEMSYTLELLPVSKSQKHICVVDMRGSVVDGIGPENTAKTINQNKIPKWKESMGMKYGEMQFLSATARYHTVYHEAFLGVGICQ